MIKLKIAQDLVLVFRIPTKDILLINPIEYNKMDPVSHYMISWLIGKKLNLRRKKYRAFLIGSIIPDIDVLTIFLGLSAFLNYHSTVTHSFLVGFILALAISVAFKEGILPYALAGILLHFFIDIAINTGIIFQGGCPLFWPFSNVKCLLVYHTNVPVTALRIVYFLIAFAMYLIALYYILKKDYPWRIFLER